MTSLEGTPARRRVYLLRHAEVSYFGPAGEPLDPRQVMLTPKGREQAAAMAQALIDVPFDRAVCSGLPRTRETAQVVLAGRDLPIEDKPEFREIRAGRLRDVSLERREAELVYAFETAGRDGARFAGGEGFGAFEARVTSAFEQILREPGWVRMLLVAHDGVNRVLIGWAAQAGLKTMSAFEQDMCCLNMLDFDVVDGAIARRLVKLVNLTPYDMAKMALNLTSLEHVFLDFRD